MKLTGPFVWLEPEGEDDNNEDEDDNNKEHGQFMPPRGRFEELTFQRTDLVLAFTTLAQFGAQAATGEFFIFHFGI